MTDRPILFSALMVRALLDGTKTQTRRVLKPQPMAGGYYDGSLRMEQVYHPDYSDPDCYARFSADAVGGGAVLEETTKLPIARDDRLWVREAHYANGYWITTDELTKTGKRKRQFVRENNGRRGVRPAAFDATGFTVIKGMPERQTGLYARLGRFMFRADSRLTLTVTDVRVQRLQDISEEDAKAEGLKHLKDGAGDDWWEAEGVFNGTSGCPVYAFSRLWNSINGPDAWAENPWVCAYSFTVRKGNIDHD